MGAYEVNYRRARAVELKSLGATYEQIADELGYASRSSAYKAVRAALKDRIATAVDLYRAIELDRLERMHLHFWQRALLGDDYAAETCIRLMDKRLRLLGIEDEGFAHHRMPNAGAPAIGDGEDTGFWADMVV